MKSHIVAGGGGVPLHVVETGDSVLCRFNSKLNALKSRQR